MPTRFSLHPWEFLGVFGKDFKLTLLAHSFVATFKAGMKKRAWDDLSMDDKIFFTQLQIEQLVSHQLTCSMQPSLDSLKPSIIRSSEENAVPKERTTRQQSCREAVWHEWTGLSVQYYRRKPKVHPGAAKQQMGPVSYKHRRKSLRGPRGHVPLFHNHVPPKEISHSKHK